MKRILLCATLAFGLPALHASDYPAAIKKQAEKMANAMLHHDIATFAQYTLPSLVTASGGRSHLLEALNSGLNEMSARGISFLSVDIGNPTNIVTANRWVGALVPQTITIRTNQGRFREDGYLVAVSKDRGKHWYFIDTAKLNAARLKTLLPPLAGRIEIPPSSPPVKLPEPAPASSTQSSAAPASSVQSTATSAGGTTSH